MRIREPGALRIRRVDACHIQEAGPVKVNIRIDVQTTEMEESCISVKIDGSDVEDELMCEIYIDLMKALRRELNEMMAERADKK